MTAGLTGGIRIVTTGSHTVINSQRSTELDDLRFGKFLQRRMDDPFPIIIHRASAQPGSFSKTADEIFVVADKTLINGYTETNAYRGFIYGGYVSGDSEFISALKVKFNSFDYSSAIFTSDKTYLEDLT